MSTNELKIAFSSTQLRVRAVFNAGYCLEMEAFPDDNVKRAQQKMESEMRAGNIGIFKTYHENIVSIWTAVREDLKAGGDPNAKIILTLAAGAPLLDGISLMKSEDPKVAYQITVDVAPVIASSWNFDWFRLNASELAKQAGIVNLPNVAQLFSAWLRAKEGMPVRNFPISTAIPDEAADAAKPFSIIGNKARKEVAVVIRDKQLFRDNTKMNNILRLANDAVAKMSDVTETPIEFLKEALIDRLKMGAQGLEKYGLNLPATYLIGFPKPTAQKRQPGTAKAASSTKAAPPKEEKIYPGRGLLQVRVDENQMEAFINAFDPGLYDHPDFEVSIDWVANELERLGIKVGMNDTIRAEITDAITKQDDLTGKLIASGLSPEGSKAPYLYAAYKDAPEIDNSGSVNMREVQQRSIVQTGQLVAEVRYKSPPKDGVNVYGKTLKATDNEELVVSLGEGVEMREAGKYYAAADGLPNIQENAISINQTMVHEGDVNLKTGNIRFDGPVEIKGAIDNGATVEVTGDLIVHGTIRGGHVRVGGSLTAKAGIVTGDKGWIRVRCDLVADFIENSNLVVGGNINVAKVLINSKVVCGGYIEADTKNGVIAGGSISCKKYIRSSKLGFPKGAATEVFGGVDWRARLGVDIRTSRLNKVMQKNSDDRNALRELARKKDGQKTKKHEELGKKLQLALQKQRLLIDKCKEHLTKAQARMTYDSEARIYVHNTLYANVKIEVGGVVVPVVNDIAEVEVSPKRARGSYIQPLVKEEPRAPAAGGDKKDKAAS